MPNNKTMGALLLACLFLAACHGKDRTEKPSPLSDKAIKDLAAKVSAAPIEVEYTKRLSTSETVRGLRVPYSGNVFTGGIDDVRCLLYVNDAYHTTQIVCPDASERAPRDTVVEAGTEDPYN